LPAAAAVAVVAVVVVCATAMPHLSQCRNVATDDARDEQQACQDELLLRNESENEHFCRAQLQLKGTHPHLNECA
jgi:hypothetical protein